MVIEQTPSLIPQTIYDNLPMVEKTQLAKMTFEAQGMFLEEYRRKQKQTGLTYLFWFLLGFHYIYLGKIGWQILYWLTFAGLGIWAIIDLFRIPGMVRNYNKDVSMDVLRDLKIMNN